MKNIIFGEMLAKLRKQKGLLQDDVGEVIGVSGKTISSWEIGRTQPSMGYIYELAKFFNVSIEYLIYGDEHERFLNRTAVVIPLYAPISCGNGGFVEDNIMEFITLPSDKLSPDKEYFAQIADGDSMINAEIHPGDILVFEKKSVIENYQIGCFCLDENIATCKKFRRTNENKIYLMPCNDKYDPIEVDLNSQFFRCIGVLVFVIKDMRGL